jgi:hypothetical protein
VTSPLRPCANPRCALCHPARRTTREGESLAELLACIAFLVLCACALVIFLALGTPPPVAP